MARSFLAIDLGATSGRTILGRLTDKGIEMEVINRFPNDLKEEDGHYHWDIEALMGNIIDGIKKAAAKAELSGVAVDTWGVDFVCFGEDGRPLAKPYSYRDPQTEGAADEFFKRIPRSRVYELTGIEVMNINSLYQLDVMRRRDDPVLRDARKLLFMPDAIACLLSGEAVCEYTISSTSQMLNARTRRLEPELLDAVGLNEGHFGRLVQPGTVIGTLKPEIQAMTGAGPVPVIAVGGHDTASAVAAVPAKGDDFAYLSSGTWSLMGIELRAPLINEEMEKLNYTNEGGVYGSVTVLKNICGMWLLERCKAGWGDVSYATLMEEALAARGGRSIIDPDAPEFAYPTDMEAAIKEYCASHGQYVPQTRGELARCIYESLAHRYAKVLEDLRHLSGKRLETLHVIGGGSRNELLNQWIADIAQVTVIAGPAEATAMGNIMVQAVAIGEAPDIASMRERMAARLELKTFIPKI